MRYAEVRIKRNLLLASDTADSWTSKPQWYEERKINGRLWRTNTGSRLCQDSDIFPDFFGQLDFHEQHHSVNATSLMAPIFLDMQMTATLPRLVQKTPALQSTSLQEIVLTLSTTVEDIIKPYFRHSLLSPNSAVYYNPSPIPPMHPNEPDPLHGNVLTFSATWNGASVFPLTSSTVTPSANSISVSPFVKSTSNTHYSHKHISQTHFQQYPLV